MKNNINVLQHVNCKQYNCTVKKRIVVNARGIDIDTRLHTGIKYSPRKKMHKQNAYSVKLL